ncbi:MAG: class I adenylate-forming enzyme family protein [Vicinamibacterales bacterium]
MADLHGAVPLLQDYLEHSARRLPDKAALVCDQQRLSYATLDRRANALAHVLLANGVTPGDRVITFADNTVETVVAFWAVLKAGAVISLVSPQTRADKLEYYLRDCRATALITDEHLRSTWEAASVASPWLKTVVVGPSDPVFVSECERPPVRTRIDIDLAAIVYTSGSSGQPRGVMLSHRNMLTAATSITSYLENREDDVILGVLPLSFDYGLYQMIMAFRTGARLVLEKSFAFPAEVVTRMVEEGVTGFPGVPTVFAMLAELTGLHGMDFSRVRYVTNTAAALPLKHVELLQTLFPAAQIYSMYGLTECKRCTYLPPNDLRRKPTSVGIAIPNTELWLVDEQDRRLGPNEVGQLVIRGATVMLGYWEKPEETARKLKSGPLPGERVLYTGDLCRLDEEGYLYFVGRTDDIIKSRGEKVAPKEIEQVLYNIPGVRDAAVVGVPDAILGQAVKAFVVLERGASLTVQDIRRECQAKLETFMIPRDVEITDTLPTTHTGKIRKTGLV